MRNGKKNYFAGSSQVGATETIGWGYLFSGVLLLLFFLPLLLFCYGVFVMAVLCRSVWQKIRFGKRTVPRLVSPLP